MPSSYQVFVSKWNILFLYSLSLIGVLIFAKGFFPMKPLPLKNASSIIPPSPENATLLKYLLNQNFMKKSSNLKVKERIRSQIPAHFKKLVFVLIDAMRFDFVDSPRYQKHMPFLEKMSLEGHRKLFKSLAKAPTVTLPRLKALLTGSVPGYLDVILNLDQSDELKEDSFVSSLVEANKNIIFYGDTTWIRLFPSAFIRKEGTLGLYVTDYTEVDTNVTRHLDKELNEKKDWDVMILHYLGLDHVGHLVGPTSPLMSSKLSEMDSVIRTIYTSLQHEKDTLIVVTSDHGMTSQGSHGGTTTPEVETPFLMLFTDPKITSWSSVETVYQTDVAATLSLLMGISIPTSSMGCAILSTLNMLNKQEELHALQYNCHHLLTHSSHSGVYNEFAGDRHPVEVYKNALQYHGSFLFGENKKSPDVYLKARNAYMECQTLLSEKMTSKLASYDYPLMAIGVLLLTTGSCLTLFLWMKLILSSRHATVSNPDSSRRITRAALALSSGCLLHLATLPGSSFVEEEHQIWHFLTASACLFLFVAFLRTIARCRESSERKTSSLYDAQLDGSSSLLRLRKDQSRNATWQLNSDGSEKEVASLQISEEENAASSAQELPTIKESHLKYVAVALLLVVVHRLTRAWNQTGIKYADLPDIEDYLNAIENKTLLSFTSCIGLIAIMILLEMMCTIRDFVRSVLTSCGLVAAYSFRVAICSVYFPWTTNSCSKGILEARFSYLCIGLLLLKSLYHRLIALCSKREKKPRSRSCSAPRICSFSDHSYSTCKSVDCFLASVSILSSLLLRPHNHCVLAFNLFIYIVLYRLLWPVVVENQRSLLKSDFPLLFLRHSESDLTSVMLVARVILACWFGQMAYFTLGNSNSFATVDLSAAYVGLSGGQGLFNYLAAGALGAFATYVGPVMWVCMCLADIVRSSSAEPHVTVTQAGSSIAGIVASTLACFRLFSLLVYVAVATGHRFHLFVWSVFSPKLMYELVSTAVQWSLVLLVLVCC